MPRSLFFELMRRQEEASSEGSVDGMPSGDQSSSEGAEGTGETAPEESGQNNGETQEGDKGDGDKPSISDTEAKLLKDMMKHKQRAQAAQSEVDNLKSQLDQVTQSLNGLSLDEVKQILDDKKQSERKELERKGEYDRIVQQMADENTAKLGAKDEEINGLKATINTLTEQLEELTIGRAFGESETVQNDLTLPQSIARREFGDHFDVVDGNIVGYDKPRGSSERTPLVNDQGEPLIFEEALKKLVKEHPDSKRILRSKAKPGAGSQTSELPKGAGKKSGSKPKTGMSRIQAALEASQ